MSAIARAGGILVAVLSTALLVAGSQLPWRAYPDEEARIRLSWRSVSEPVSECRTPTPEELAALPPHMRMQEICERRHAPFRLVVRVDGRVARDATLAPAGARGDRPVYVFEELRVAQGLHRIEIRFSEENPSAARAARELALDATLELAARDVALVTLDGSGERLAIRMPDR